MKAEFIIALFSLAIAASGCGRDMQMQPSYKPMKAPRLHSPVGSIPLESRSVLPDPARNGAERLDRGRALFFINCQPCHGDGTGNGPVARYLKERPADLRGPDFQTTAAQDIYYYITDGAGFMPPFRGILSAPERWQIALFVKSLPGETQGNHP